MLPDLKKLLTYWLIGGNIYIVAGEQRKLNRLVVIQAMWRVVRVVEGARLESVCTVILYREFESLTLRHFFTQKPVKYIMTPRLFKENASSIFLHRG